MVMLILFFVLYNLMNSSYAIPVTLENCIHWGGQLNITAIRIPSCQSEPCLLRIQVPLDIEIDFVPSISLDSIQTQTSMYYFGDYFFIYLVPFTEVCSKSDANFQCPVQANHPYTISSKMLLDVKPGESTKLPNTWKIDVRVSGIKNDIVELTDCSMNLMIDH